MSEVASRACSLAELLGWPTPSAPAALVAPPIDATGWVPIQHPDGVELAHESGEASIRLGEHRGEPPVALIADAIAHACAALDVAAPRALERHVTAEGAYAAIAVIENADLITTRAWIFGEHVHAELVAVATPTHAARVDALVRGLVAGHSFGVEARLRRFLYAPPSGWRGAARGLHADWRDGTAVVTVMPACPRDHAPRLAASDLLVRAPRVAGDFVDEPPVRLDLGADLRGTSERRAGSTRVVYDVVLDDGRFLYPFRLATDPTRERADVAVLEGVYRSTVPLAATTSHPTSTLFDWI